MNLPKDSGNNVVDAWLTSGNTVRISGLDFAPIPHPILTDVAQCIVKGQAAVYFLRQHPQGHIWLLKKFASSRRPSDAYLEAVHRCLPGGIEFFTCTQRRLINSEHVDRRYSKHRSEEFFAWLEGTILMPKVPGEPWATVADNLREGDVSLSLLRRLRVAANLAACIERLEAGSCSHRDLSCTNVFLDSDDRVYLIDWDSMYHSHLSFQENTTTGTMGYIAPFTRGPSGGWNAKRSWCPTADRYALAIHVAEILLTDPKQGPPQEDGTLFAQAHLNDPSQRCVQVRVDAVSKMDPSIGRLLREAIDAPSFDACPSPCQWQTALRRASRSAQAAPGAASSRDPGSRQACTACGTQTWVTDAWYARLRCHGTPFLCPACRRKQNRERDRARPLVSCEHCKQRTRIARERLEVLRAKGSPLLCSDCLASQLEKWNHEQEAWNRDHVATACSQCGAGFRIRKTRMEHLSNQGKAILCRACLEPVLANSRVRRSRGRSVYGFQLP